MDGVPVEERDWGAAELPGEIEYACAHFARLSFPDHVTQEDLESGDFEPLHLTWAKRIHFSADRWLDANGSRV